MAKNWAIAIGINQYENLSNLKYAVRDAELMKNWFEDEARFDKVYLFTDSSPQITDADQPYNSQPNRATLRRFLRVRLEKPFLSAGDNLWFFFSGHGMRHGNSDYLLPSDVDPHPEELESSAIALAYVTERLRKCGADNIVLILDACRDEGSSKGLGIGEEKQQGVITIASCSPAESSYEIEELQQGSFTYSLLQGLRINGEGNCATVERLYFYLRNQVPEINRVYKKPRQTPYAIVEPASKYHLILLPEYIQPTLEDISRLREYALEAEAENNLKLAETLWNRLVKFDQERALRALRRIWSKSQQQHETIISNKEAASKNSQSGQKTPTAEPQIIKSRRDNSQRRLEKATTSRSRAPRSNLPIALNLSRRRLLQIVGFTGTGIGLAFFVRTTKKEKPEFQAQKIYDLVKQPALQNINIRQAIEESGSNSVTIAILADSISPYLKEVIGDRLLEGKSFVSGETVMNVENAHGTLVSSIVAAVAPNAKILPVKVLANSAGGFYREILKGIEYAIEEQADILLMPFESDISLSTVYKGIFEKAKIAKNLSLAAAGNKLSIKRVYPAAIPDVLAVAATNNQGQIADLSNYGEWVSLAAPGVNIISFGIDGKTQSISGTSFSAAITAGVAALMLSVNPDLTPDEIEKILQETSTNKAELQQKIASGQIDALAAVKKAKNYK